MCEKYECRLCRQTRRRFCQDHQASTEDCSFAAGHNVFKITDGTYECSTCLVLHSVTTHLRSLIFREPWREHGSTLEIPNKAAWEENKSAAFADPDSEDDGYTREEREAIRQDAESAVARRWDQMKHEQANSNKQQPKNKDGGSEDGRPKELDQPQESSVTPSDTSSSGSSG